MPFWNVYKDPFRIEPLPSNSWMLKIFVFLTLGKSGSVLGKANMMVLTKEATDKDRSLKTQLFLSTNNSDEKLSGETVWRSGGYFSDTRP